MRGGGGRSKDGVAANARWSKRGTSPSRLIDARIKELGDWRGETYKNAVKVFKALVRDAVALNESSSRG